VEGDTAGFNFVTLTVDSGLLCIDSPLKFYASQFVILSVYCSACLWS